MLNKRCRSIIQYMLRQKKPINSLSLANNFCVSERTIQYDLKKIDEWLIKNNISPLKRNTRNGIQIDESKETNIEINNLIYGLTPKLYIYSSKERIYYIALKLLEGEPHLKISNLAEILYISNTTVFNDLSGVKSYFASYQIKLCSKQGRGFYIEGKEWDIRRAYTNLLWVVYVFYENRNISNESNIVVSGLKKWNDGKYPINIFKSINIDYIIECVLLFQNQRRILFTDRDFARLCLNITVSCIRIKKGFTISIPSEQKDFIEDSEDNQIMKKIIMHLEKSYQIKISKDEVSYIILYFLISKVQDYDKEKDIYKFLHEKLISVESISMAQEIINTVGSKLGININDNKYVLLNIAIHLNSLLNRLRFNIPVEKNPILYDIQKNYPDVFNTTKDVLHQVLSKYVCKVDDNEISYITIHLGAAIQVLLENKSAQKPKPARILIVCGSGLGTGSLLSSRLINEFENIELLGVKPYYEFERNINKYSYDILISTVSLDDLGVDYILVDPLLSYKDVEKLNYYMNENSTKDVLSIINTVLKTTYQIAEINDYKKKQIEAEVFKIIIGQKYTYGIEMPGLSEMLQYQHILLQQDVKDWKEAIRVASKPLKEMGYISQTYIEEMILNKEQFGAYIVIDKGVAMPHALPEHGVKKPCFSLLTIANPVRFGHSDNDPVDVVIILASINSWIHLNALYEIHVLLNNRNAMNIIRRTSNPQKVIDCYINN